MNMRLEGHCSTLVCQPLFLLQIPPCPTTGWWAGWLAGELPRLPTGLVSAESPLLTPSFDYTPVFHLHGTTGIYIAEASYSSQNK